MSMKPLLLWAFGNSCQSIFSGQSNFILEHPQSSGCSISHHPHHFSFSTVRSPTSHSFFQFLCSFMNTCMKSGCSFTESCYPVSMKPNHCSNTRKPLTTQVLIGSQNLPCTNTMNVVLSSSYHLTVSMLFHISPHASAIMPVSSLSTIQSSHPNGSNSSS